MIKINNGFDTVFNAAGKALEVAPKIYDDAIQTAAQESGKTLELIPRTINAAFSPLRKWIAHREYSVAETEKILASKLANVSAEKIVSPEPYVAVPAIQAISYTMDNDTLRNLYANLLANSMNSDTKNLVHPSFVEIIKQLSPLDAKLFKVLVEEKVRPLVNINKSELNDISGHQVIFRNLTMYSIDSPENISISIDNLQRLNIIEIPDGICYTDPRAYELFDNVPFYKNLKLQYKNSPQSKIDIDKKVINITNLGNSFYNICVKN